MEKINQKNIDLDSTTLNQHKDIFSDQTYQETFKYHDKARKPFIDLFQKGFDIEAKIFYQQTIGLGNALTGL